MQTHLGSGWLGQMHTRGANQVVFTLDTLPALPEPPKSCPPWSMHSQCSAASAGCWLDNGVLGFGLLLEHAGNNKLCYLPTASGSVLEAFNRGRSVWHVRVCVVSTVGDTQTGPPSTPRGPQRQTLLPTGQG